MTDTLAELDPEALRREITLLFAEPKSLHHIAAAGLDGVHRHLTQLSEAITAAATGADQVVDTVTALCNLVRQEQRKHLGAVAQAKKEHARAEQLAERVELLTSLAASGLAEVEQLRGELADYQLAASEAQGAAQRLPQSGDQVLVTIVGELNIDPHGYGTHTLLVRPGPRGTEVGYVNLPPTATITLLGAAGQPHAGDDSHEVEIGGCRVQFTGPGAAAVAAAVRAHAAPCWCGHGSNAHVTDGGDNAVCRTCIDAPGMFRRAFHVNTPEKQA